MTSDPHPDPTRLWKYRRKHSFLAHYTLITLSFALPAVEVFRPGTVSGLSPVLALIYSAEVLIVIAYIANCAAETWIREKWK